MSPSPAPPESLRLLSPADAGWLAALHAQCFDERRRWPAELMASFLRGGAAYGRAFLTGARPAALLLGQIAGDAAEIVTLATLPDFRRRGAAQSLIAALAEEARARRCARLLLEVDQGNEAAIALYLRTGFRKTGSRPAYYRHETGASDALLMEKPLQG